MATDRATFAQWCLDNILPSVLSDPGTREDLEAFYNLIGQVEEETIGPNRDALSSVISPDDCPTSPVMLKVDDAEVPTGLTALDGLMGLVGFGRALAWARDLDEEGKRRLVRLGARLWRTKGTPDGTRALLYALTARDPMVFDFPFWRFEVGDPFPVIAWPAQTEDGDQSMSFHVADPDATIDRTRVVAALKTVKPANDVWTVVWLLAAETWASGLYLWDPTGSPSVVDGTAVIPDGAAIAAATGGTWDIGRVFGKVALDAGAVAEFRIGTSDGEYILTVGESGITIQAVVDEVATLVTSAAYVVVAGLDFLLDWRINPIVGGVEFRVVIDGELVAVATA